MTKKKKDNLQVHFIFKEEERHIKEHASKTGNASHWYRKAAVEKFKKESKV